MEVFSDGGHLKGNVFSRGSENSGTGCHQETSRDLQPVCACARSRTTAFANHDLLHIEFSLYTLHRQKFVGALTLHGVCGAHVLIRRAVHDADARIDLDGCNKGEMVKESQRVRERKERACIGRK